MKRLSRILTLMLLLLGGAGLTSCELFFSDNPISPRLKVKTSTLTVEVDQTKRCNVSASTRAKLLYGSSDEAIAVVDQNGLVTGVAEGIAYITVIATNSESTDIFFDESAIITVTVIDEDSPEVKKGTISYATTSISKTYGDEPFTNPLTKTGNGKVTYTSSNTAVAVVNSETGQVTIKGNGETTITATVEDTNKYTYEKKTASYTLGVGTATMTVTAEGYTGTYDEKAHGIKVTAPEGATIKYGTTEGSYTLTTSPTYTNAGTYTVYYQVSKMDYTTVTGSADVTINKADMEVTATGYADTYDGSAHSITVTAPSGATIKYGTTAGSYTLTANPTYTDVGTYTVYYEVSKENYNSVEGSATVEITKADMEVTATGYAGTYDGSAHGITVTAPTGATIKYGTTKGSYTQTANPTYTDAGTYTVYYEVTKTGYTTVTGSATVEITKKAAEISYAADVTKNYGDDPFTNALTDTGDAKANGKVSYSSSNTAVATIDSDGKVTIKGNGTTTITATVTEEKNYAYATKTATYTLAVTHTGNEGTQDYENDTEQDW